MNQSASETVAEKWNKWNNVTVEADTDTGGRFKALKVCVYVLYSINSTGMFLSEKGSGCFFITSTSHCSLRVHFGHYHDNKEVSDSVCE